MSRRLAPLSAADVRRCLVAAVELSGGQDAWASRNGLTQSYVANLIAGKRSPGARALAALGLRERPATYEPVREDRS